MIYVYIIICNILILFTVFEYFDGIDATTFNLISLIITRIIAILLFSDKFHHEYKGQIQ